MPAEPFVDQDMCISCGLCVANLPNVFRFAANGKAECYAPTGADHHEIQQQAVDLCPVLCICWRDAAH